MSIHKSQGQTLERVKVDLGKVFEKGYFCLSSSLLHHKLLRGIQDKHMLHSPVLHLLTVFKCSTSMLTKSKPLFMH